MEKNASLYLLKILLSLTVVSVHVGFLKGFSTDINYLFTQGFFRIAVGIFFIISGFYFKQLIVTKKPIFPWFKHLFTLYLFWSLVYIYFIWPKNQSVFDTLVSLGRTFLIGYMHLWYIAATIETAILVYIIRNISDKYKIVLIFITYGIGLFIEYSGNYHLFASSMIDNLFNKGHVYRNFLFFGFPMFTLGYLIRKYQIYDNYSVKEIITFIFFGFILLGCEAWMNLYFSGDKTQGFDMLFSSLIVSPFLFLLVLKLKWSTNSKIMSDISTTIYLIHPLFLTFIAYFGIKGGILVMLLAIGLSVLSSLLLIPLNKKVKIFL